VLDLGRGRLRRRCVRIARRAAPRAHERRAGEQVAPGEAPFMRRHGRHRCSRQSAANPSRRFRTSST